MVWAAILRWEHEARALAQVRAGDDECRRLADAQPARRDVGDVRSGSQRVQGDAEQTECQ